MIFNERDLFAFLGTNCQFLELFVNSLGTTSLDLYLLIILVSAKNVVLHKYSIEKGSSIFTEFETAWVLSIHC